MRHQEPVKTLFDILFGNKKRRSERSTAVYWFQWTENGLIYIVLPSSSIGLCFVCNLCKYGIEPMAMFKSKWNWNFVFKINLAIAYNCYNNVPITSSPAESKAPTWLDWFAVSQSLSIFLGRIWVPSSCCGCCNDYRVSSLFDWPVCRNPPSRLSAPLPLRCSGNLVW